LNIEYLILLSYISVSNNHLTGPIPQSISTLSNLTALYMSGNHLTGNIDMLGSLFSLVTLTVGNNRLVGSLPASFYQLTKLKGLYLHENVFTSTIPPEWTTFDELVYLTLYENLLTGSLSASAYSWKSIIVYSIDDNLLSGSLTDSIRNLISLQQFTLYSNYFTSSVPTSLSSLSNLTVLLLEDNLFTGKLDGVFNKSIQTKLQSIDVSANYFTGDIPINAFVPSLDSFIAYQTCFSSSIPADICNSQSLNLLVLDGLTSYCSSAIWPGISDNPRYSKSVSKGVPSCVWMLPNITELHLSGNDLSGSIPNLLNYGNLTNLDLSCNRFTGTVPQTLQNWTKLRNLNLQNNRFSGVITYMNGLHYTYSSDSSSLTTDDFEHGNLATAGSDSSNDPDANDGLTLYLSSNRFSGIIPPAIEYAENINIVDGNLFSCSTKHQPPYHDPNSNNYVCASTLLDISLYCMLSVGGIGFLLLSTMIYTIVLRWRTFLTQQTKPENDHEMQKHNNNNNQRNSNSTRIQSATNLFHASSSQLANIYHQELEEYHKFLAKYPTISEDHQQSSWFLLYKQQWWMFKLFSIQSLYYRNLVIEIKDFTV
jgi:hypothetical protein